MLGHAEGRMRPLVLRDLCSSLGCLFSIGGYGTVGGSVRDPPQINLGLSWFPLHQRSSELSTRAHQFQSRAHPKQLPGFSLQT